MATCRYCFNEWKPGGDWHKPDCLILTGTISTLALLKKRKAKAKKRPGIATESPRVKKLEGF